MVGSAYTEQAILVILLLASSLSHPHEGNKKFWGNEAPFFENEGTVWSLVLILHVFICISNTNYYITVAKAFLS